MDKKTIRQNMKNKRLFMNKETFFIHSQIIYNKVLNHPKYKQSKTVGIYVSTNHEVDTLALIAKMIKDHVVCVPRIENHQMCFYRIYSLDDLKEGYFHIQEPITQDYIKPKDIDLMIVPMLAFDDSLNRVGYGKGFYDRYFSHDFDGYKLGLAFSYQKVDKIDINEYDYPLDEVVTEV